MRMVSAKYQPVTAIESTGGLREIVRRVTRRG
jgi:hypothetical protein